MEQLENIISPQLLKKAAQLDLGLGNHFPKQMSQALEASVLKGGKRLRPLLVYLMCDLFEISNDPRVETYAKAIELVHSASLSHDDVIDNATMRRNSPSINLLLGNKKSILTGDYLLGEVIVQVTNAKNLRLVQELAKVIQDLAYGEWLQMDLLNKWPLTPKDIEEVARHKTASVMSWCCIVGPILSQRSEEICQLTRNFGLEFGLAFQLIDDILDMGDAETGKDVLKDLQSGTINRVLLELISILGSETQKPTIPATPWWTTQELQNAINIVYQEANTKITQAKNYLELLTTPENSINKSLNYLLDSLLFRIPILKQ